MLKPKFLMGILLTLVAGCASTAETARVPATQPAHAECVVCKMNADLACVDVTLDGTTPHCVYDGTTYHFCSDECRAKFMKDPAKYAGK